MKEWFKFFDDEIFVAALIAGLYAVQGRLRGLSRDGYNYFYDLIPQTLTISAEQFAALAK